MVFVVIQIELYMDILLDIPHKIASRPKARILLIKNNFKFKSSIKHKYVKSPCISRPSAILRLFLKNPRMIIFKVYSAFLSSLNINYFLIDIS